jgi:hypothetical protein
MIGECPFLRIALLLTLAAVLTACGGTSNLSGGGLAPQTVSGTVVLAHSMMAGADCTVSLDDDPREFPCDEEDHFQLRHVPDGDHSLFVHTPDGGEVEIPCQILDGRGISLGETSIRNGEFMGHTGFDGYRCAFLDQDGDGFNDLFADADGDGFCDEGKPYAGYPYMMS